MLLMNLGYINTRYMVIYMYTYMLKRKKEKRLRADVSSAVQKR